MLLTKLIYNTIPFSPHVANKKRQFLIVYNITLVSFPSCGCANDVVNNQTNYQGYWSVIRSQSYILWMVKEFVKLSDVCQDYCQDYRQCSYLSVFGWMVRVSYLSVFGWMVRVSYL